MTTPRPDTLSPSSPSATARSAGALSPPSLRLAAIDVGSNSIHMIVAQIDPDGGVTTLWRMKEPTGLGRASFPSRQISPDAMDRAVATLARFVHAARQKSAEKIVAVATSAVREATNGGDLIERARRELKLVIRVVSAREEARLIYLGVRHGGCFGKAPDEPHLAIDIGGGSVELMVGTNERAMLLESRKLGAARMTARFIRSDPPAKQEIDKLRAHYEKELNPLLDQVLAIRPLAAVGTSGTLENIARMCSAGDAGASAGGGEGENKPAAPVIESKRVEKLLGRLLKTTSAERARMPGLDDARKDQIIAGVLLVQLILGRLKELDLDRITLCSAALREGILIDYVQRRLPAMRIRREVPDPRRRCVLDLCRRCEWHREHSEQVTRLTLRLYDELQDLHQLAPPDRELIEYAALMHDIGWHIGRRGHHKHSAYLIRHGNLRQFTAEEVLVMANIARYHRKAPPRRSHPLYARLLPRARRTVDAGAALLRIADGLDRSHGGVVRDLKCEVKPQKVRIRLETRSDAELEIWGARRKADMFEKVFGRSVEFEHAPRLHPTGKPC